MCMANQLCFQLKQSKLAILFQLTLLLVMLCMMWWLFNFWIWCAICVSALIGYFFFCRQPKINTIEQLDQKTWSLQYVEREKVYSFQLDRLIDHQIYMIIYSQNPSLSLIIWCDQVSQQEWKRLKVMTKLL